MEQQDLKRLFQQEFSRMVAVITKRFGLQHVEIAEDIVSESFLAAAEVWGLKGVPENPTAWLYTVAKRNALHHLKRTKILHEKIIPAIQKKQEEELIELNFSAENIKDSQLQMMFAICNPVIASEAQIGLALRILCGFGIDEIADAFFTNKETINKRLLRAKDRLRKAGVELEIPPENEIPPRLDNVLKIIYLLFNEGYYSRTHDEILRKDLCLEALRLGLQLAEYDLTARPKTHALVALMCFHISRFEARQAADTSFVLYEQQNEELWNKELIRRGMHFLELSAEGDEASSYHLEARIAFWHCTKKDSAEKWRDILWLYDQLLRINYSPSAILNRVFALYKLQGAAAALAEAEKLNMEGNHFYHVLLAELHKELDPEKAREHLEKAHKAARTETERSFLESRITGLQQG